MGKRHDSAHSALNRLDRSPFLIGAYAFGDRLPKFVTGQPPPAYIVVAGEGTISAEDDMAIALARSRVFFPAADQG